MHIDHPVALAMDQRRQFVHMVAIIAVIIGVWLDPFPAGIKQGGFDDRQIVTRHHDVEIADAAPDAGSEICRDIGGAFHQHDLARIAGQRPSRAVRFPQGLLAGEIMGADGILQNSAHPVRHGDIGEPMRQRADQRFRARDADQFRPLAAVQPLDAGRFPQRADKDIRIADHGDGLHRLSISSSACSID